MESKILDAIKVLHKKLESDWKPELEEMNIWEYVSNLYEEYDKENSKMIPRFKGNRRISNTILAYIVFAYHNNSRWLDMHKDRTDVKTEIMSSLAGISFKTQEAYCDAIIGLKEPYNTVIEWIIDAQMDRRWKTILTDLEYHSKAQYIAKFAVGGKDMAESGRMLSIAETRLESANKLLETLRNENVKLDSALSKENRKKVTERENSNFMSWETFIRGRDMDIKEALDLSSGADNAEYEIVN